MVRKTIEELEEQEKNLARKIREFKTVAEFKLEKHKKEYDTVIATLRILKETQQTLEQPIPCESCTNNSKGATWCLRNGCPGGCMPNDILYPMFKSVDNPPEVILIPAKPLDLNDPNKYEGRPQ